MEYAGFLRRFFAWVIDDLAITIIAAILLFILSGLLNLTSDTGSGLLDILSFGLLILSIILIVLLQFLYFGILWGRDGQSLGMKLLRIKVIDQEDGEGAVTFFQGALRGSFGYWISGVIFGLGYIWAAFDGKKEAWHDKIFETWVVRV